MDKNTGFDFETFLEDWLAPIAFIVFAVMFFVFVTSL